MSFELSGKVEMLDISWLSENLNNSRIRFDEESIKGLAESMKRVGIMSPLTVTKQGARYTIISGARRLRAARMAGIHLVPCIVMDPSEIETLQMNIVENIQREQLHPLDEADALMRLIRVSGRTARATALMVGVTPQYMWERIKVLNLTDELMAQYRIGELTNSQAKALARVPQRMQRAAKVVLDEVGSAATLNGALRNIRLNAGEKRAGLRLRRDAKHPIIRRLRTISGSPLTPEVIEILEQCADTVEPMIESYVLQLFNEAGEDCS